MEQFQPGLSFSPDNRAEKHRRLHGLMDVFNVIQPGLKRLHVRISVAGWISARAEISAPGSSNRAEILPGLKLLSCNRVLCFIRIL